MTSTDGDLEARLRHVEMVQAADRVIMARIEGDLAAIAAHTKEISDVIVGWKGGLAVLGIAGTLAMVAISALMAWVTRKWLA